VATISKLLIALAVEKTPKKRRKKSTKTIAILPRLAASASKTFHARREGCLLAIQR